MILSLSLSIDHTFIITHTIITNTDHHNVDHHQNKDIVIYYKTCNDRHITLPTATTITITTFDLKPYQQLKSLALSDEDLTY